MLTQNDPVLIVTNSYINEDAAKAVAGSKAFLLLKTDKNILSYPEVVEIAQHRIGTDLYSIIGKSCNVEPLYVRVKADTVNVKNLSKDSLPWVSELKSKVSCLKNPEQNVFLVISSVPTDGIYNFSRELVSVAEFSDVRLYM